MRFRKDAAQMMHSGDLESAQPARPADLVSDVVVPVLQAVLTGVFVASVLTFALSEWGDYRGDLGRFWLFWFLAVSVVAWFVVLADTRRLLWALERWTGRDLDGDRRVGEPRERLVFVDRERARQETARDRERGEWLSFVDFVRRLDVKGTSLAAWERELGRETYAEYRDALIDYGFAAWRSYNGDGLPNTSQGWALTADSADVLARLSLLG